MSLLDGLNKGSDTLDVTNNFGLRFGEFGPQIISGPGIPTRTDLPDGSWWIRSDATGYTSTIYISIGGTWSPLFPNTTLSLDFTTFRTGVKSFDESSGLSFRRNSMAFSVQTSDRTVSTWASSGSFGTAPNGALDTVLIGQRLAQTTTFNSPKVTFGSDLVCMLEGDSGCSASQWTDQSGYNNHATQATGANQPTPAGSTMNGVSVPTFNGSTQFYYLPDFSSVCSGGAIAFVVAQNTSTVWFTPTTNSGIWKLGNNSDGFEHYPFGDDGIAYIAGFSSTRLTWSPAQGEVESPFMLGVSSFSGFHSAGVNSVVSAKTSSGTNTVGFVTAGQAVLGASTFGSTTPSFFWLGKIAAFYVIKRQTTTSEIADFAAYIQKKFGVNISGASADQSSSSRGLVLEESRSNYLAAPRAKTNTTYWNAGQGTLTGNYTAGPDGLIFADRDSISAGQFGTYYPTTTTGSAITGSCWVSTTSGAAGLNQSYISDGGGGLVAKLYSIPTTWSRGSVTGAWSTGTSQWEPQTSQDETAGGGGAPGALDNITDLHQAENGKYPTEWIDTDISGTQTSFTAPTTRAGTRFSYGGENLFRANERFNDTYWTAPGCTIGANLGSTSSSGPTSPADQIIEDGSLASLHGVSATALSVDGFDSSGNTTYNSPSGSWGGSTGKVTISVYVKAGLRTKISLSPRFGSTGSDGIDAVFDLSAGTVFFTGTAGTGVIDGTTITNAGNSFWRVSVTFHGLTEGYGCVVYVLPFNDAAVSYVYNGSNGSVALEVNGFQMHRATDTIPEAYHNAPENVLPYSEDFSKWSTAATSVGLKLGTRIVGIPGAPTSAASQIIEDQTNAFHSIFYDPVSVGSASAWTLQCYLKAKAQSWARLKIVLSDTSSVKAWFDLSTGNKGSVVASAGTGTSSMVPVGDGWYFCAVTFTNANSLLEVTIDAMTGDLGTSYQGISGRVALEVNGAQAGRASSQTMYLATTGSQRLYAAYSSHAGTDLIHNGKLITHFIFTPKGSSSEQSGDVLFWFLDNSNYAGWRTASSKIEVNVAGTLYTTPKTFTWNRYDKLDVMINLGGTAVVNEISAGVNTTTRTDLTAGNTPIGIATNIISSVRVLDFFSSGYTNQFSAWIHNIKILK